MNSFLQKINSKLKILKNFFNINPHKHWNFLVYTFLTLVFVFVLFSFYLLSEIRNEKIFQVTTTQKDNPILIKETLLKNIINLYDKKAKKVLDANTTLVPYNDPSL